MSRGYGRMEKAIIASIAELRAEGGGEVVQTKDVKARTLEKTRYGRVPITRVEMGKRGKWSQKGEYYYPSFESSFYRAFKILVDAGVIKWVKEDSNSIWPDWATSEQIYEWIDSAREAGKRAGLEWVLAEERKKRAADRIYKASPKNKERREREKVERKQWIDGLIKERDEAKKKAKAAG